MRRPLTQLAVFLSVATGAGVAYGHIAGTGAGQPAMGAATPVNRTLHLHGHVRGLYPGAKRNLWIYIRNRVQNPPVVVRSVRGRVARTTRGCPASSLHLRPFRGHRYIGSGRRRSVPLRARLARSAVESCQGAKFELHYRARATVREDER
jgi:hypothetical protein